MNLLEQCLELFFEDFVFRSLIEFAYEMATRFQDIEAELQSCSAQILV